MDRSETMSTPILYSHEESGHSYKVALALACTHVRVDVRCCSRSVERDPAAQTTLKSFAWEPRRRPEEPSQRAHCSIGTSPDVGQGTLSSVDRPPSRSRVRRDRTCRVSGTWTIVLPPLTVRGRVLSTGNGRATDFGAGAPLLDRRFCRGTRGPGRDGERPFCAWAQEMR